MAEQLVKFDMLFKFIQEQKVGSRAAINQVPNNLGYRNHTIGFLDQVVSDFINNFIGKYKVHMVPDQMIVWDNLKEKKRIRRAATLLTQDKITKLITYYYNTKLHFCLCVGVVL